MAALPYLPHAQADIRAMLDRIGAKQLDDLYSYELEEGEYLPRVPFPSRKSATFLLLWRRRTPG